MIRQRLFALTLAAVMVLSVVGAGAGVAAADEGDVDDEVDEVEPAEEEADEDEDVNETDEEEANNETDEAESSLGALVSDFVQTNQNETDGPFGLAVVEFVHEHIPADLPEQAGPSDNDQGPPADVGPDGDDDADDEEDEEAADDGDEVADE